MHKKLIFLLIPGLKKDTIYMKHLSTPLIILITNIILVDTI